LIPKGCHGNDDGMSNPVFFQHILPLRRMLQRAGWVFLAASLVWMAYQIFQQARVVEDAYISFRVVDNAVQGYGLRWNSDERVQVFTNPLWTLLHIPFYALWPHIEEITLILSGLCVVGGLVMIMRSAAFNPWVAASILVIPFACSYTFTSYATSGLENPLSFFLFCWFGWALYKAPKEYFWLHVGLACALSVVNRMDTALLYLPAMLFLLVTRYPHIRWRQLMLAGLPLLAWCGFSLIYYGFIFPNTKYAKLTTLIPQHEFMVQGLRYFANLVLTDIIMAASLLLAIKSGVALARDYRRQRDEHSGLLAAVVAGILLYVLYVIYVGGNQRFGRFWSLPVAAGLWVHYALWSGRMTLRPALLVAAVVLAVHMTYPSYHWLQAKIPFAFQGMFFSNDGDSMYRARRYKPVMPRSEPHTGVISAFEVGKMGFRYGPKVHIIDRFGLGDPLLARIKSDRMHLNVVGHFPRQLPKGYDHAVRTGQLQQMPKKLARYYRALRVVTRGPVWNRQRLRTIVDFQLGRYDHLVP
jgi:arabinofuranosyltransferase